MSSGVIVSGVIVSLIITGTSSIVHPYTKSIKNKKKSIAFFIVLFCFLHEPLIITKGALAVFRKSLIIYILLQFAFVPALFFVRSIFVRSYFRDIDTRPLFCIMA